MMSMRKKLKVSVFCALSCMHAFIFSSSNSSTLPRIERSSRYLDTIESDVKDILEILERETSDDTPEYTQRDALDEKLRESLTSNSPLEHYPHLDEATYNRLIKVLRKNLKDTSEFKPATLLHAWSFLTGIPVVGLKQSSGYYYYNWHLLPSADSDEIENIDITFNEKVLCARLGSEPRGQKHKHYAVTNDLFLSAIKFRRRFLGMKRSQDEREKAAIAWNLLEDEFVPLDNLDNEDSGTPVKNLLRTLLKFNSQNEAPFYGLGIIRLLQNTALYLSEADQKNGTVVSSPCSKETFNYLGFRDGIIVEREKSTMQDIENLIGGLLCRRIFFERYICASGGYPSACKNCTPLLTTLYYPHYTFSMIGDETIDSINAFRSRGSVESAMRSFGSSFSHYLKGNFDTDDDNFIKELLEYMDSLQLRRALLKKESLAKVVFEPTVRLDLSSEVSSEPSSSRFSASSANLYTLLSRRYTSPVRFVDMLITHLRCIEYQQLRFLNLSDNNIGQTEAEKLGEAFEDNIIPDLESLDLNGNEIGIEGVISLHSLLLRDVFKSLLLSSNLVLRRPRKIKPGAWAKISVPAEDEDSSSS